MSYTYFTLKESRVQNHFKQISVEPEDFPNLGKISRFDAQILLVFLLDLVLQIP